MQASYADFVWGLPPATDPLYPSVGISTPEQKSGERYKVIMVGKESPAEAAGFKVGDELVSIDGVAYTDKETVNRLMSEKRWGDAVVYKVMRDGQEQTLTAYLRRQPPKPPARRRRREAPASEARLGGRRPRRGAAAGRRRSRGRPAAAVAARAAAPTARVRHALQVTPRPGARLARGRRTQLGGARPGSRVAREHAVPAARGAEDHGAPSPP